MPAPTDKITKDFTWGEFFPQHLFPVLPTVESTLTKMFVELFLQPLRDLLNATLTINAGSLTAAGWRSIREKQAKGAGLSSDHMLLALNKFAVGAADLHCVKFSAAEVTAAIAILVKSGNVPVPREVLWESRNGTEWVHVAYPVAFKQSLGLPFRPTRSFRDDTDVFWRVINDTERFPIVVDMAKWR